MESFVENLTWDDLTPAMLRAFPNLIDAFERKHYGLQDWTPGQYVVFGDIFIRYMETEVTLSQDASVRVAHFLERMAASRVENIEDLHSQRRLGLGLKRSHPHSSTVVDAPCVP